MKHNLSTHAGLKNSNNTVLAYLESLSQGGFWGAVRIKYEAGRAVHILREESLIPERMTESPRKNINVHSSYNE
jgi:hypothetical protein